MRLKSLKLSGFKSFANPTSFTFRHGITAIVGPNGCGKSNVIDAIRWVLGESSAKQLRGGAMSDVIFAGSQEKAAKSLASVELTFEHTQDEQTGIRHELNLYQELSVRRQVNIEGKSEYFINGTRCRRRDVVDVFLGTGLGPRSYSVIQQGMIGRIVDSSPLQLREFIEEAAGVSRYQARRSETQKKLDKTQENLERLHDIESELRRQQKKLAKQAKSATEYQQIKASLNETKQQRVTYQLYQAKSVQMQYKTKHDQQRSALEQKQQSAENVKQKYDKLSARMAEEQWLKDDARERLHAQDMARQQAEHTLKGLESNISELEVRLASAATKLKHTRQQQQDMALEQTQQLEQLERLNPELEAQQAQKQQLQSQIQPQQVAWEQCNNQVTALEEEKWKLEQRIAINQQNLQRLQQDLTKWQAKEQTWQQEATKWGLTDDDNSQDTDKALNEINNQLESLHNQKDTIYDQLDINKPELNQLQSGLDECKDEYVALEKRHTSMMAEYDTLHQILHVKPKHDQSDSQKHSDSNFASQEQDSFLNQLPSLHEQISLTPQGQKYTHVLDKWLGVWLDAAIISQSDVKSDMNQWLTNLPVYGSLGDSSDNGDTDSAKHNTPNQQNVTSVFIECDDSDVRDNRPADQNTNDDNLIPFSTLIAKPQLALWQYGYLYLDNLDEQINESNPPLKAIAELLSKLPTASFICTQSGWLISQIGAIHFSKLSGTAQNSQSLSQRLQQQQRLAVLEDALNNIEDSMDVLNKRIKQQQTQYDQAVIYVDELTAQLSALTQEIHNLQQQQVTQTAQRDRQLSEQHRLIQQRQELDSEYTEISKALKDAKQHQNDKQLQTLLPKLSEAKEALKRMDQQRQQVVVQERQIQDSMNQLQVQISQAQLKQQHANEQHAQLTQTCEQLNQRIEQLTQQIETTEAKLPQHKMTVKEVAQTYHELKIAFEERQSVINQLQTEITEHKQHQEAMAHDIQQLQNELAESNTNIAIANERISEASDRLQALNSEINPDVLLNEYLVSNYLVHGHSVSDDQIQALQNQENQLTAQLDKIGPVNLAAAQELVSINERLDPLAEQVDDIQASIETLSQAIESIDAKTKRLFLATLEAVNESLNGLFTKVFGGGQAYLSLVKEDGVPKSEQWRAGLELMAQPKGKKNSRLAVLSGGEKTLTALSLIFAIFKQHPAPFCVLDEVDAPLDDANVGRFTSLIADLADEVQFIFISHNKLAMQIADELKGITMPQAGISTLVSVSLEEAEQYIEPTA